MLRRVVAERVRDLVADVIDHNPKRSFRDFVRNLIIETGCSQKMVNEQLALYKITVENDMLVKTDE